MPKIEHYITSLLVLFFPIKGLVISVGLVIILDTITGVYRSVKITGWKSIQSERLGHVIGKMLLYNSALITFYIIDHFILGEFTRIWFQTPYLATKIVSLVLVFVELTSIKENLEQTFGINLFLLLKTAFQRSKELKDGFTNLTK